MGNCIELQKPVSWVDDEDDEWESAAGEALSGKDRERKEEGNGKETGSREIRIKISKKQLEQLLQQVDGEGLPLRQVLADLAGVGGDAGKLQPRHWRPNLQSIPEVAEFV